MSKTVLIRERWIHERFKKYHYMHVDSFPSVISLHFFKNDEERASKNLSEMSRILIAKMNSGQFRCLSRHWIVMYSNYLSNKINECLRFHFSKLETKYKNETKKIVLRKRLPHVSSNDWKFIENMFELAEFDSET